MLRGCPALLTDRQASFVRFQFETGRTVDRAQPPLMTHSGRKSWKSFGPLGGVNPTCCARLEVYGLRPGKCSKGPPRRSQPLGFISKCARTP
jgi:hypothetical protein